MPSSSRDSAMGVNDHHDEGSPFLQQPRVVGERKAGLP